MYFYQRRGYALDRELRGDLLRAEKNLVIGADDRVEWSGKPLSFPLRWAWNAPWIEIWTDHGVLVRRLWPLEDLSLTDELTAPPSGLPKYATIAVTPTLQLRTATAAFRAHGLTYTLRALRIQGSETEALDLVVVPVVIALPLLIGLVVVGGLAMGRSWLRPLDRLVSAANQISAEDLSRRLPIANPHDELGHLTAVFNTTLARLESSFSALDQFVANASHELRTPLTALRNVGEVGLGQPRTPEDYCEIIGSMLEEARRLQFLVDQLLRLARLEGGAPVTGHQKIRVDRIVATGIEELGILAEEKDQRITVEMSECATLSDPVFFRQALQNLLDNAIKYSPRGSEINVAVKETAAACTVSVMDCGPGIAVEHRARLTDRFFRTDKARERGQGGFGLGLAITKAYMQVLGGSLDYQPREPTGSIFRLILPRL
jgi:heavy metal sensor kinase